MAGLWDRENAAILLGSDAKIIFVFVPPRKVCANKIDFLWKLQNSLSMNSDFFFAVWPEMTVELFNKKRGLKVFFPLHSFFLSKWRDMKEAVIGAATSNVVDKRGISPFNQPRKLLVKTNQ